MRGLTQPNSCSYTVRSIMCAARVKKPARGGSMSGLTTTIHAIYSG
jgi:hypothetical protein